ncbi:MAG: methionyl-tRNA formyltransferase [Deltaproteobacteria bacterium]|nr:methionyl-tRNA formyltransferase [Deltaproteobacteria bacterium]
MPRAVFFGTPDFAVPSLRALAETLDVVAVVCRPDRPKGRGLETSPPPVKVEALARGIDVRQPDGVKDPAFAAWLRDLSLDVAVVAAYGHIVPAAVLEAPRLGCVNVHASLLPRWRGAAPVQWAVISGDAETGVCLMQMDVGMDTGAVLARRTSPIGPDETAGEVLARVAILGGELVRAEIPALLEGRLVPEPQDPSLATKAPRLLKEHGAIDFAKPARAVHDLVRGVHPWPGAFTGLGVRMLKVHRTRVVDESGLRGAPGEVLAADAHGLVVACGSGSVALIELQLEGRKRLQVGEFLAGHPVRRGAILAPAAAD